MKIVEALSTIAIEKTTEGLDDMVRDLTKIGSSLHKSLTVDIMMGMYSHTGIDRDKLTQMRIIARDRGPAFRFLVWLTYVCDPTKNGAFSKWLFHKLVVKGQWSDKAASGVYYEDIATLADYFEDYEAAKPRLPTDDRDINRFKTIDEFVQYARDIPEEMLMGKRALQAEERAEMIRKKEIIVLYDDETLNISTPRTEEAAMLLGRNTRWCTAARNNNAFHAYAEEGDLYVILDKKANKRWQIHVWTDQYMDEEDEPYSIQDLLEAYPQVGIIFKKEGEQLLRNFQAHSGFSFHGNQFAIKTMYEMLGEKAYPFNQQFLLNTSLPPDFLRKIPFGILLDSQLEDAIYHLSTLHKARKCKHPALHYLKVTSPRDFLSAVEYDWSNIYLLPREILTTEFLDDMPLNSREEAIKHFGLDYYADHE